MSECPEGHVCDTLIIKGEPYKFPTDWLYSPGGYGYGIFAGGSGMDSVAAGIANLPSPYEMLLMKEGARKAACRNMQRRALELAGGAGFFKALQRWVTEAGKKVLKEGAYWGGVLLTMEIVYFYVECPDFWGGSTYHHTDGIG